MPMQLTGDVEDLLEKDRHKSPSLCRLLPFIDLTTVHLSAWLVAVTAAETALHRVRPPTAHTSPGARPPRRPRRFDDARSVVLLLVVLIVCLDAHCFWSYSLVEMDRTPPGELICSNMRQNELFRDVIRPAVELLVLNVAPFTTLVLALFAVIIGLILSTSDVKRGQNLEAETEANFWRLRPRSRPKIIMKKVPSND